MLSALKAGAILKQGPHLRKQHAAQLRSGPAPAEAEAGPAAPTHPLMVNFTTARREPAALSSGWNSVSLAITFTPTILAARRGAERTAAERTGEERSGGPDLAPDPAPT